MTSDITSEIAQRLDVGPDDAGALLDTALKRIRETVAHAGFARLDGLGTFRRRDEGLTFEPDPSLAEAINARFTGLHDLILEAAAEDRQAPDAPAAIEEKDAADERPRDDEAERFWNDRHQREEPHPLGPQSEPPYEDAEFLVLRDRSGDEEDPDAMRGAPTVSWNPAGAAAEEGTRRKPPLAEPSDEASAESHDEPSTEASGDPLAEPFAAPSTAASGEPPTEPSDESSAEPSAPRAAGRVGIGSDSSIRSTSPPSRRDRERRDPKPIWFGVGVIVLVAAAAVAIFILSDAPQDAPVEETSQVEAPPATPDASPLAADDTATAQNAEAPPSSPPSPFTAPLRSDDPIVPGAGGYTIVVYSETNQGLADEEAARYGEQGFRAGLLPLEDGAARYRVGVGQFETLEEAAQQRDEHAGAALPPDSWVLRLSP